MGFGSDKNEVNIKVVVDAKEGIKVFNQLGKEIDSTEKEVTEAAGAFSKFGASIVTLNQGVDLLGRGLRAVNQVITSTFAALDKADKIEALSAGFDNLQKSVGVNAAEAMRDLQRETDGLISKMDLMKAANKAVLLGVDKGTGEFAKLSSAAVKLGRAMGIDAKSSIDSLTIGIGRQSRLVLDNLGVVVKAEVAYKNYAKQIGKTVEALSQEERQLAFSAEAYEQIFEKASQLADIQQTAAIAATQTKAAWADLTAEFFLGISSSGDLEQAFSELAQTLGEMDVEQLGKDVGDLAAVIVNLVDAILPTLESSLSGIVHQVNVLSLTVQNFLDLDWGSSTGGSWVNSMAAAIQKLNREAQLTKAAGLGALVGMSKELTEGLGDKSTGVAGAADNAAKKIRDLGIEYKRFAQTVQTRSLAREFKDAIDALDQADLTRLKEVILENAHDGYMLGIQKYIGTQYEADARKQVEILTEEMRIGLDDQILVREEKEVAAQQKIINKELDDRKEMYTEAVDFFELAFMDAIDGSTDRLESELKRIAIAFVKQMAVNWLMTGSLGGGAGGGDIGGVIMNAAIGQGASSMLGGSATGGVVGGGAAGGMAGGTAVGALLAAAVAFYGGSLVAESSKKKGIDSPKGIAGGAAAGAAIGSVVPVVGTIVGAIVGAIAGGVIDEFAGSSKNLGQRKRDATRAAIAENTGISEDLTFPLFGPERGSIGTSKTGKPNQVLDTDNPMSGFASMLTSGIGNIFGGEQGENFGNIFANAVAEGESFNEVLLNTQVLMNTLGITVEQAKGELLALFNSGEISLDEFGEGLNGLNILARDNLIGEGSIGEAFRLLAENIEEKPGSAIKALELAFKEASEIGTDQLGIVSDFLQQAFGEDAAGVYDELKSIGIETWADIQSATADQVFAMTSILKDMGLNGTDAFDKIADAAENFEGTATSAIQTVANYMESTLGTAASDVFNFLQDIGISTWEQIANASGEQIARIVEFLNSLGLIGTEVFNDLKNQAAETQETIANAADPEANLSTESSFEPKDFSGGGGSSGGGGGGGSSATPKLTKKQQRTKNKKERRRAAVKARRETAQALIGSSDDYQAILLSLQAGTIDQEDAGNVISTMYKEALESLKTLEGAQKQYNKELRKTGEVSGETAENLWDAQKAVEEFGDIELPTPEDVAAALDPIAKFLKGGGSAADTLAEIDDDARLGGTGLVDKGAWKQAVQDLIDSGGSTGGQFTVGALRNIAIESKEAGLSMGELMDNVMDTFGPDMQQLFFAFNKEGVTNITDLANASDQKFIEIIRSAEEMEVPFKETTDRVKDLLEELNKLPETKKVRIDLETVLSGDGGELLRERLEKHVIDLGDGDEVERETPGEGGNKNPFNRSDNPIKWKEWRKVHGKGRHSGALTA